jgi:hypothetical protein
MKHTRLRRLLAATAAAASLCALAPAAPASAAPNTPGEYVALPTPTRILDTRNAIGRAGTSPVGPGQTIDVQVTGANGGAVPATGVETVVMNVTAAGPTSEGYVSVWPTGDRPGNLVSSLNFVAGQTVPNLVTVRVGAGGRVTLLNAFGNTHLIADVVGYYDDAATSGGTYNPLTPARILDTRSASSATGGQPVGQSQTINVPIAGRGGVPAASQVSAVALNITATDQSAGGYVSVWPGPSGNARPNVSTLNFGPQQTIANLAVVTVAADGTINLFNERGTSHLIADVVGWFDRNGTQGLVFTSISPTRAVDTRPSNDPIGQAQGPFVSPLALIGRSTAGVRAVVMNVTATGGTSDSYFALYPPTLATPPYTPVPNTSNLNWKAGQTVPNAVMTQVAGPGLPGIAEGDVVVYNAFGQVHLIADVVGYFTARPA